MEHILDNNQAKAFILAGKATFTVQNADTGRRFTFNVVKPKEHTPHFVKVLTSPDNEGGYSYLGTIFDGQTYRHGRKSRISQDAQSAKVFDWFWRHLLTDDLPEAINVYHEGCCGRCGRKLTVPGSILMGYGPECIKIVGMVH